MIYDKNCTVLVNSCDLYEEAWEPFFQLFEKYWKDCPYEVCLNTESKQFSKYGVRTINFTGESWSDRLKNALKVIHTPYVILMLEDFFLMADVRQDEIYKLIEEMKNDCNIAAFYFKKGGKIKEFDTKYDEYSLMNNKGKYIINFQTGLWNTHILSKIIENGKSPWEIEENPNPNICENYAFYCYKKSTAKKCDGEVFQYLWSLSTGYGICKSKWLWNNKKFFRREGIDFRYKTLKKMSWLEYEISVLKKKIKNRLRRMWGKNNG